MGLALKDDELIDGVLPEIVIQWNALAERLPIIGKALCILAVTIV